VQMRQSSAQPDAQPVVTTGIPTTVSGRGSLVRSCGCAQRVDMPGRWLTTGSAARWHVRHPTGSIAALTCRTERSARRTADTRRRQHPPVEVEHRFTAPEHARHAQAVAVPQADPQVRRALGQKPCHAPRRCCGIWRGEAARPRTGNSARRRRRTYELRDRRAASAQEVNRPTTHL